MGVCHVAVLRGKMCCWAPVEQTPFDDHDDTITLTVSIGLVAAIELARPNIDLLVTRANKRLWLARKQGGNGVVLRDEARD